MPVWKTATGEYYVLNKFKVNTYTLSAGNKSITPDLDIVVVENTTGNVTLTLPHHMNVNGKLVFVKTKTINVGHTVTVAVETGSTIDGAQTKALAASKSYIFVAANNGWVTILE